MQTRLLACAIGGNMRPVHASKEMLMSNSELCFMPATEMATAIREKRLSPVEAVDAVYERIHALNPKLNAFCTLTEDTARENAREAEAAVMHGDALGPLHGVPV